MHRNVIRNTLNYVCDLEPFSKIRSHLHLYCYNLLATETLLRYINRWNTNGKLSRTAQAGEHYIDVWFTLIVTCLFVHTVLSIICGSH